MFRIPVRHPSVEAIRPARAVVLARRSLAPLHGLLRRMRLPLGGLALCLALPGCAQERGSDERSELRIGEQRLQVELAVDAATRQRGLMEREALAENAGMLFVFEDAGNHCFWMRNTPLPLSVAFIDEQGRILNLADMQPHSDSLHCASGAARFGLEVNQGWFAKHAVRAGQRVEGLPGAVNETGNRH